MVELRTLTYFAAACRHETLAQAADTLGIALSTLSVSLKGLEQELGLPLFHRAGTGLHPNDHARWLLRTAEPLLDAESFARRWVGLSRQRSTRRLSVEIALSFTIGGVGAALQRATETFAADYPDVLVDPVWTDEKDVPQVGALADALPLARTSQLLLGLATGRRRGGRHRTVITSEQWVFAYRVPAGTRRLADAADLMAGRLVVPTLAPALIEQVDRYLERHDVHGVRFVECHPGDLARLLDDYPDAALFVPASLVTPRLGLARVRTVAPEPTLTIEITARSPHPDSVTTRFVRHLQRALNETRLPTPRRPAISSRQVRYFNLVHRLRSVSGAARAANVAQPSLSEQLHKLESELGTSLFSRQGDGVIPNARGDRFAVMAAIMESGIQRISRSHVAATPPGKRVNIGILPSVSQHGLLVNRIADAVLAVQSRHPALRLTIQEAPNSTLQDWVLRGLVGVAVVETGLPRMPRLPLGSSEALAAIVHARHDILPSGPVKLADLLQLPLALPTSRFGLRQLLDAAADPRGLRVQPVLEIDALTMVAAVLDRLPAYTILPPSGVHRELAAGDLVAHPIIEPEIARRLFVIYSAERTLSEPERDLVNTLRDGLTDSPIE